MRKYTPKSAALNTLGALILLLAAAITAVSVAYLSSFRIVMISVIAVCWVAALLSVAVILPLYFTRTVIYISAAEVTLHTGVLFVRREHMKAESVQYCSCVTLPLSGLTGFNFVVLHALGASVILPFLSKKDAEEITAVFHSRISSKNN